MFTGDGVEVSDVPAPKVVSPSDVIVKVSRTAICGSDLHLLDGKTPGMRPGGIIGHEFVGTVEEAGKESGHEEGTRVLGSFLIVCGVCPRCRAARFNHCVERRALGLGTLTGDLDGAQAEFVRVPNARVNLRPLDGAFAEVDDDRAVFCGDVLATGVYAAHMAEAAPGRTVAVIGGGPVGALSALAAKARGARVVLLDQDPERVSFATETLGLEAAVVGDPLEVVQTALGGQADATIEAVGHTSAFRSSLKTTADGGIVVVVGVYGTERYELPMGMAWIRALDIRFAGMANVQAHWSEALDRVADGSIDPSATITHRLPLDDAVEGYELFAARDSHEGGARAVRLRQTSSLARPLLRLPTCRIQDRTSRPGRPLPRRRGTGPRSLPRYGPRGNPA